MWTRPTQTISWQCLTHQRCMSTKFSSRIWWMKRRMAKATQSKSWRWKSVGSWRQSKDMNSCFTFLDLEILSTIKLNLFNWSLSSCFKSIRSSLVLLSSHFTSRPLSHIKCWSRKMINTFKSCGLWKMKLKVKIMVWFTHLLTNRRQKTVWEYGNTLIWRYLFSKWSRWFGKLNKLDLHTWRGFTVTWISPIFCRLSSLITSFRKKWTLISHTLNLNQDPSSSDM